MRREACFHGAHRHTHTSIHGLINQAIRTARLSVTIWKNFRRNRRARFGGLGSVLSVPWKSASLGKDSGWFQKAEVPLVTTAGTCVDGVVGPPASISGMGSLQLGIGRIAV